MKEIKDICEIHAIEFEMLVYLHDVCLILDLKYYLAYGTLIGAIRHKSFIPWDDDVDIMMPRKEIEKLSDYINSGNHPFYKMVSSYSNEDFTSPLPKLIDTRTLLVQNYGFIENVELGAYIDIFPIDGVPGDINTARSYYDKAYIGYLMWIKADTSIFIPGVNMVKSIIRWIKNIRYKFKGYKFYLQKLEHYCSTYDFYETEYVSVLTAGTPGANRNVWKKDFFTSIVNVEINGKLFIAPAEYDAILRNEYGDYMELPPPEYRISHHLYKLYWK